MAIVKAKNDASDTIHTFSVDSILNLIEVHAAKDSTKPSGFGSEDLKRFVKFARETPGQPSKTLSELSDSHVPKR
jgi:ankyrin repeat protein